jgi:3-methyladenine DNA glycosylase/8-oxoguanine DNA glycosylase
VSALPAARGRRPQGGGWRRPAAGTRELRVEVTPPWPFRLSRASGMDGVLRCRDGVVRRLLHDVDGHPVVVRVAQTSRDCVLFGAQARTTESAAWGIERMRFALGVDDDLRAFHDRFRDDPLIGGAVRAHPELRVRRRPLPFEALAWAVTEQLIEYVRAAAIQRRIVWRLGRHHAPSDLRDLPSAATLAAQAPALLCSFDLADKRAIALRRVAQEVATGRVDLFDPDHERGWRRLGQGRMDQLPAGDLAYRKLVGRLLTGDPRARVDEQDVRSFFAPYGEWAGLAGAFALRAAAPELKAVGAAA